MKIIVDENIPFVRGLLEPVAEVVYLPGDAITAREAADADALIVRTRTRCDRSLLEGSRCRFIATATIGTDHIDLDYCRRRGIAVANAPGCNAPGVAQYVMAAIANLRPEAQTIGIVGVGHVGSIVERWARSAGMEVLLNDPPRAAAEGPEAFTSLDEIARRADVVTFHTPLDATTHHLADERFFASLGRKPLVINAARGGVMDEEAALSALGDGRVGALAVDCWEGEPHISRRLLDAAAIATPHIAGYSFEGKVRATRMAVDALTAHFGLPTLTASLPPTPAPPEAITLARAAESYDIPADTRSLKAAPEAFENLRNNYNYRHEPRP